MYGSELILYLNTFDFLMSYREYEGFAMDVCIECREKGFFSGPLGSPSHSSFHFELQPPLSVKFCNLVWPDERKRCSLFDESQLEERRRTSFNPRLEDAEKLLEDLFETCESIKNK